MFQESDRKFQEDREQMKESSAKFDREMEKLRESQMETDRIIKETAESQKETDRIIKETAESQKETDRQMKETDRRMKKTDRQMKKTYKKIGELGNRFGELVEHLVLPNIEKKFNQLGFTFSRSSPNVKIKNLENPKESFEIDVFLENGDVAIAVEVKAKPNEDDVKGHILRMKKLRRYADKTKDKRRFQGAIAGAVMDDTIRAHILKKKFYLIEQTGDTVIINVPEGFKAREW